MSKHDILSQIYFVQRLQSRTGNPGCKSVVYLFAAPGSCPDHDQHTLHGLFAWPKTEPQDMAIVLCQKNKKERATRFW